VASLLEKRGETAGNTGVGGNLTPQAESKNAQMTKRIKRTASLHKK
jgi:hypothetical protein